MAPPTKIGFYLNYVWDEPTRTACAVADYLASAGASVTFLTSQPRRDDVHSHWDGEVVCEHRRKFDDWVQGCSHLVWLDVPLHLKTVQMKRQKNVLLFSWHRMTPEKMSRLNEFDTILCPGESAYRSLFKLDHCRDRLVHAPFDVNVPGISPVCSGQQRIFCPVDSYTARTAGLGLLHALQVQLDAEPDLHVTIGYGRNWSSEGVKTLEAMQVRHGSRLRLLKRPTWLTRCEAYATHDLVCDFSLRQSTGMFALEALAHGRPVLAFDVAPMHEIIQAGTGWRVPCGINYNAVGAPEADVNYADLHSCLQVALRAVAAKDVAPANIWEKLRRARHDKFSKALQVGLGLL